MTQLSINQNVGSISLNNPPLNTLTIPIIDDLIGKLQECKSAGVRAVVIRSSLDHIFSAGIDPKAVLDADLNGRKQIFKSLGALINAMLSIPAPILGDINGPAQAGGAVLAALCDMNAIKNGAGKICFSEVKVGLAIPRSIISLVGAKVPPGLLFETCVLGKNINSKDAISFGLANFVYDTEADKETWFETQLAKISRLDSSPVGHTLMDVRQPAIAAMKKFDEELEGFTKHLTDEYLGKGLKQVLESTKG